ncbi:YcaO-like family protein [Virgibacillus kimchii]
MLHFYEYDYLFNIPSNIFLQEKYYLSYSYFGKVVDNNGNVSPSGCNAIASNKKESFIKSMSESLERRSLMFGGYRNEQTEENYIKAWNILNNEEKLLPYHYTRYSVTPPYVIDTTGTASHFKSEQAVNNAIREILEKNALFLFWYGKEGYKLKTNYFDKNTYYKRLRLNEFCVEVYTNYYFAPLISVFSIIKKGNLIYASGAGTGFNIEEAIDKSLSEAYLLTWQNITVGNIQSFNSSYHMECINYLNNFIEGSYKFIKGYGETNERKLILKSIPHWVEDLYVILLNKSIFTQYKTLKVFSTYLNNHIPLKSRLNLRQPININTINLTQEDLKKIPDCIII